MGGRRVTAVAIGIALFAVAIGAPGQETAPVVKIRQPLGLVSHQCQCKATCGLGVPCDNCAGAVESPVSNTLISGETISPRTCEPAGCANPNGAICGRCASESCIGNCGKAKPEFTGLITSPGGVIYRGCGPGCAKVGCKGGCGGPALSDWRCADLCCRDGFWIRADYLMWWVNDDDIPSLVTSSSLGTPIDDVGVLGLPTTTNEFDGPLAGGLRSGGRLSFGYSLDGRGSGLEGSLWGLENVQENQTWASNGNPSYARPFFNVDPLVNDQDAEIVSFPGLLDGSVSVRSSSDLYSGNFGLRCNLLCCSDFCDFSSTRIDLTAGYRYFRLREGVEITESLESTSLGGPVVLGTRFDLFDRFRTTNEFHGAEFGMAAATQYGRWTGEVTSRVAIGNVARTVRIEGGTTVTVPGFAPNTRSGGLLAQSTNIGTYQDSEFAFLPQFGANLGYHINCDLKFTFGYTFMYLGDVVRPGDVIDPVVNGLLLDPTLPFAGPERPSFDWNDSDLWVMGMNFGFEYLF